MGKFKISPFLLLFSLIFLISCDTETKKNNDETLSNQNKKELNWEDFNASFEALKLPAFFPPDEGIAIPHKLIATELIAKFFSKKPFEWAMGLERDVPNLSEHSDSATKFSAIGKIIIKDSNIVYVILKQKEGAKDFYYYLITTSAKGEYISGICVSFQEGDNENSLGRTASINTDLSIEISQSEYSKGKRSKPQTAFFEIGHNGKIAAIKRQQ
ncbi:MAG: hypothetical protein NTX03_03015 [Bacteroidetes bacterium]|nr:hypothetical protein [Bacteroidota bacterium]